MINIMNHACNRKKTIKIILVILGLLILILPVFCLESLKQILSPNTDFGILFPASLDLSGTATVLNGKYSTNFVLDVDKTNNGLTIKTTSPIYSSTAICAKDLKTISCITTYSAAAPDKIKDIGHNKRISEYNEQKRQLVTKYYLNGKEVKNRTFDYAHSDISSDIVIIQLQALLLKGVYHFNADMILHELGEKFNVDFKFIEVEDMSALSPDFPFPAKARPYLKLRKRAYGYIMTFTGLIGFFHPYKYFYVFEKEYPHNFIAYWGGEPSKRESFIAYSELE